MPIRTFLATLYPLYISFGLHFGARCCAITHLVPLVNLINGICNLILGVARLSGSRLVKIVFFLETWFRGASTVLSAGLATLPKDRFIERQTRTIALPQDWNGTILAY